MTMRSMPGFRAEAALDKAVGRYRTTGGYQPFLAGSSQVLPQLPIGFCMADCDFNNSNDPFMAMVCKMQCMGDGGGGGGNSPGEPTCRPSCTRCRSLPGQSGRWKTCINRNCDDREVRC